MPIRQQQVEVAVEVPVPMTQEEIVHVPKIIQQERNHHFHVEEIVDIEIIQKIAQRKKPILQEEITHVPKIMKQIVTVQRIVEKYVDAPQLQIIGGRRGAGAEAGASAHDHQGAEACRGR